MFNELYLHLLACPNCKDALNERLSAGFALSIGLMMVVPFLIFFAWTVAIVWLRNRSTEDISLELVANTQTRAIK